MQAKDLSLPALDTCTIDLKAISDCMATPPPPADPAAAAAAVNAQVGTALTALRALTSVHRVACCDQGPPL